MPRVSVLIPTFNRKLLVSQAIDSVLEQSLQDFEIVVVDDGSTDGTADMLAARYGADPRVRVVVKENGGVSSARNAGIAVVRGTYLAFLDSDDRCLPDRLEIQVRALEDHSEAALCLGDAALLGDGFRDAAPNLFGLKNFKPPRSLAAMFNWGWTLPSTMMLRTEVARSLPFDETLAGNEDVDFLIRFFLEGHEVVFIPEEVAVHRTEGVPGAATRLSDRKEMMDEARLRMLSQNYRRMSAAQRKEVRVPDYLGHDLVQYHRKRRQWAQVSWYYLDRWRKDPHRVRYLLRWIRYRFRSS